jgi:hypothetical protein
MLPISADLDPAALYDVGGEINERMRLMPIPEHCPYMSPLVQCNHSVFNSPSTEVRHEEGSCTIIFLHALGRGHYWKRPGSLISHYHRLLAMPMRVRARPLHLLVSRAVNSVQLLRLVRGRPTLWRIAPIRRGGEEGTPLFPPSGSRFMDVSVGGGSSA